MQEALHFRADVIVVPAGTLPRFEMKAKRFRATAKPKITPTVRRYLRASPGHTDGRTTIRNEASDLLTRWTRTIS